MTAGPTLSVIPVVGMGDVVAGSPLPRMIADAVDLRDGDVVVVSSKVVAKAEGMLQRPAAGESVEDARRRLTLRDEVLVQTPHVVVVRTRHGYVCANAGIDASNVGHGELLLLPRDPDTSAAAIRHDLAGFADVGVIISDTFGRAWREGQTDVALGVAGVAPLRDERGTTDRDGRPLTVTLVAVADQVAGAADLVRDKAAGIPVVIVRGLGHLVGAGEGAGGAALIRPAAADLFPHGRGWLARRLATGQGAAVRTGVPARWEWDLVVRAAGGAVTADGVMLRCHDGLSAGRAEACLLDLGYAVSVVPEGAGYTVTTGV
ncbi:MAG TPA: coenzyme F420-0:L-glutamate ligase [Euzebya sp.]|nr:coenzyme F420-0:L-glutamate ligase [Euzebya sp.]